MARPKHIPVLDHLRGFAALSVCLHHFTGGVVDFLPREDPIKFIGSFGRLGVEMFFVISGFVIPYALFLRGYRVRDCVSFFIRRLKRLEPPYLACIFLVIILHQLSSMAPGFRGGTLNLTWARLLAHLGYLNAILDYGWLSPVFWTLAIEFQYYLFIALVFPILVHRNPVIRGASPLTISLLALAGSGNHALLLHWLPLFAIGMASFQYYTRQVEFRWFAVVFVFLVAISVSVVGWQETLAGVSTAIVILIAASRELPAALKPLAFAGVISYSLYLVHLPIGGRVVNLATRLPESVLYRYPAICTAVIASVAVAYVFWWCVERPSQMWSHNHSNRSIRQSG